MSWLSNYAELGSERVDSVETGGEGKRNQGNSTDQEQTRKECVCGATTTWSIRTIKEARSAEGAGH